MADFNKAIEIDPNDVQAYIGRGDVYSRRGEHQKAMADYNKVIDLKDVNKNDMAEVYINRGYIYFRKGEYQSVIDALDKAICLQPNNARAYNLKGLVYFRKGKYQRALENFNKALDINRRYTTVYRHRGLTYTAMENYSDAISDHTAAITLLQDGDPTPLARAYDARGLTYAAMEKYDQAIEDYDMAIKQISNNAWMYLNRGSAYYRKNEHEKAIEDYDKVFRVCSNYQTALDEDPELFMHLGQGAQKEAIKLLKTVIRKTEGLSTQAICQGRNRTITNSSQGKKFQFRFDEDLIDFQTSKGCYYFGVLKLFENSLPGVVWNAFNAAFELGFEPEQDVKHHLHKLRKANPNFKADPKAHYNSVCPPKKFVYV
jgi:tetratricopeptide (TPR) repeat protein